MGYMGKMEKGNDYNGLYGGSGLRVWSGKYAGVS